MICTKEMVPRINKLEEKCPDCGRIKIHCPYFMQRLMLWLEEGKSYQEAHKIAEQEVIG